MPTLRSSRISPPPPENVDRRPNEIIYFQFRDLLIPYVGDKVPNSSNASLKKAWAFRAAFRIKIDVVMIAIALVNQAPNRKTPAPVVINSE